MIRKKRNSFRSTTEWSFFDSLLSCFLFPVSGGVIVFFCFSPRMEGGKWLLCGGWGSFRLFVSFVCLFRASHDQRLAAGPRQGHLVLDPRKMLAHFSVFFMSRRSLCTAGGVPGSGCSAGIFSRMRRSRCMLMRFLRYPTDFFRWSYNGFSRPRPGCRPPCR